MTSEERDERVVGKYPISVASKLTGVPEHRLRAYEAAELLEPERSEGGTRLYSDVEIELVRRIAELADKDINYAGIKEILAITGEREAEEE